MTRSTSGRSKRPPSLSLSGWGIRQLTENRASKRLAAVVVILIAAAVGYLVLLYYFRVYETPAEQQFGAAAGAAAVQIYVEPISIDAHNHSMQGDVSLTARRALREQLVTAPDRDLFLILTHGKTAQEIKFPANQPIPTATFAIDLTGGNVANYPFDRYRADLSVQCFANALPPAADAKLLPAEVGVWEAVLGFHLETTEQPGSNASEVRLRFDIRRSGGFSLFALAAYGAMVVLGCSALTIGILAFTGVRRPDPPFVGALGAIVFALPALRNALPGAPPLGVRADMFVFLWTETAAVIAVALFVSTWARSGPRP
jgi:Domain of unknown function (DUF4436)